MFFRIFYLLPTLLCGLAPLLEAQAISYANIAWDSSPELVTLRLHDLGYSLQSRQSTPSGVEVTYIGKTITDSVYVSRSEQGITIIHAVAYAADDETARARFDARRQALRVSYGPGRAGQDSDVWFWGDTHGNELMLTVDGHRIAELYTSALFNAQIQTALQQIRAAQADSIRREREGWYWDRADAQTWRAMFIGDSVAVSYNPARTVRVSTGRFIAWVRWDYRVPRYEPSVGTISATVDKEEINCTGLRLMVEMVVYYNGSRVVDSSSINTPRWEDTIPGSDGEYVAQYICGRR